MAMLQRQQANHIAHPQRKLANMKIDAGGVFARRIIDRIIAAERTGAPA
jgi:vanillate O-demethylase monooxygenase subunit